MVSDHWQQPPQVPTSCSSAWRLFASSRRAVGAVHLLGWISFLGLPKQSTTNWVVYNNKLFSHRSGGNKVQNEGVSTARLWKALGRILSCLFLASWPSWVGGSITPVSASRTNTLRERTPCGGRLGLREVGYRSKGGPRPVASLVYIMCCWQLSNQCWGFHQSFPRNGISIKKCFTNQASPIY